jgi:DNA-binding CsgD family transcriptional regulator
MDEEPLRNEDIYDALCDDEAFSELPSRLALAFGARSCVIHWHFADGGAAVLADSGYFSPEQMQRYADEFAALDPWARASAVLDIKNRPQNLEDIVPAGEFERSEFFNEYIRPMGDDTFHCMGVRIANDWGAGMIAMQRGQKQAPFSDETVRALDRKIPHLRRMLSVRGRISAEGRTSRQLCDTLDGLGEAVFTTRASGRIIHANAAATAMLREGNILFAQRGLIRTAAAGVDGELQQALHAAAARNEPSASALRLPCRAGGAAILSLLPIGSSHGGERLVLLTVTRESGHDATLEQRLCELFGLSPGEVYLAVRLAEGARLEELADERQVTIGTIRFQVKSIMAKMGCHRQSEVVALVSKLPRLWGR